MVVLELSMVVLHEMDELGVHHFMAEEAEEAEEVLEDEQDEYHSVVELDELESLAQIMVMLEQFQQEVEVVVVAWHLLAEHEQGDKSL